MGKKFKIGDVVYLNSNKNKLMTVYKIDCNDVHCKHWNKNYSLVFSDVFNKNVISKRFSDNNSDKTSLKAEDFEIGDVVYLNSDDIRSMTVYKKYGNNIYCKCWDGDIIINEVFNCSMLHKTILHNKQEINNTKLSGVTFADVDGAKSTNTDETKNKLPKHATKLKLDNINTIEDLKKFIINDYSDVVENYIKETINKTIDGIEEYLINDYASVMEKWCKEDYPIYIGDEIFQYFREIILPCLKSKENINDIKSFITYHNELVRKSVAEQVHKNHDLIRKLSNSVYY